MVDSRVMSVLWMQYTVWLSADATSWSRVTDAGAKWVEVSDVNWSDPSHPLGMTRKAARDEDFG